MIATPHTLASPHLPPLCSTCSSNCRLLGMPLCIRSTKRGHGCYDAGMVRTAGHAQVSRRAIAALRCARRRVQPWKTGRAQQRRRRVAAGAQASAVLPLLPVLADAAASIATAVADAITLRTADGNAIVSITPPVGLPPTWRCTVTLQETSDHVYTMDGLLYRWQRQRQQQQHRPMCGKWRHCPRSRAGLRLQQHGYC